MHSRRARPTLRLLTEDLKDGWASPHPRRMLDQGRVDELHPLSELPHPIIAKAAEAFAHGAVTDNYVGHIACSTKIRLMEIKSGQWRRSVAGRRKRRALAHCCGLGEGNHEDHDDFYQLIQGENTHGHPARWLPTADDHRLLKRETAARLVTEWELAVQEQLFNALGEVHSGGTVRLAVLHPMPGRGELATMDLTVAAVREDDYQADEIELEIIPERTFAGSNLIWQLTTRALITLSPPEQGWDRHKDTYSTIAEPGHFSTRSEELAALVAEERLGESEPGQWAHYAHRLHLADKTISGHAVRALCGVYFVPTQDHESLPCCPSCQERHAELPD